MIVHLNEEWFDDDILINTYDIKVGDIIEVIRNDVDNGYYTEFLDYHGNKCFLYDSQVAIAVADTELARFMYPDAIEKDGWLYVKRKEQDSD